MENSEPEGKGSRFGGVEESNGLKVLFLSSESYSGQVPTFIHVWQQENTDEAAALVRGPTELCSTQVLSALMNKLTTPSRSERA